MKYVITGTEADKQIKDYLYYDAGYSRRMLKVLKFGGGSILLNGTAAQVREKLVEGDELEIIFPEEERGDRFRPDKLPLDIVFEDDHVLVINKPAGIPTIPSYQHPYGTIANRVLAHYDAQGLSYTFHVVTRLDRGTSGLLLIAKHRFSHSLLSKSQKEGEVRRTYQALVHGRMEKKTGTIDAPIGRKPGSIIERQVTEEGQKAITHYQVMNEKEEYCLVEVKLETGRTHQIRVHFSFIGHPLLGDTLYGGCERGITRQALHSSTLSFIHPFSRQRLTYSAALPGDFSTLI